MNYTKEEWRFSNNRYWKTNPYSIVVKKHGINSVAIANIPARLTVSKEEAEANARLISSAPDLLNAVRGALFVCERVMKDYGPNPVGINLKLLADQLRKAIKKAEGAS